MTLKHQGHSLSQELLFKPAKDHHIYVQRKKSDPTRRPDGARLFLDSHLHFHDVHQTKTTYCIGRAQDKKDRVTLEGSPSYTKNKLDSYYENNLAIGPSTLILSLNIEGISVVKCAYLSHLLKKYNVDIVLLQETHLSNNAPASRYNINGYSVINQQNHQQYGIIT